MFKVRACACVRGVEVEGSVASLLSRDPPVFPLSQSGSLCCGVCSCCSFTASSAAPPPPLLCRSTADTNPATHGHHPDRPGGDLGTWTGGSWCININPREETHAELRRKDARTDGGDSAASFLHEPERNLSTFLHLLLGFKQGLLSSTCSPGSASCFRALGGAHGGLCGSSCPPSCCCCRSTCLPRARRTTPTAASAKAKGKTAQV